MSGIQQVLYKQSHIKGQPQRIGRKALLADPYIVCKPKIRVNKLRHAEGNESSNFVCLLF